ncbi:MAG TPA: Stp1/IreP family PP2C-type Ser/Thr phosphatase [Polyangiaceae bacterium]|nr:Stp1/IreP family PP2C-type Ser/Thr phosphatase [Polyangiaceae bacterium]
MTQNESSAGRGEIRVKLFARTDVGQIREHNEDNFLVADLTRKARGLIEANRSLVVGPYGSLFAVCDGMGGAAAGEIASQLAVDILYERMVEGLENSPPLTRDDLARRLVRAIEAAGLRIFQEAKVDRTRRGMGTTVTAAALVDGHLFFAQVGDSRGYVLRQGELVQLTRDQSLVNQLIEAGQLTEEEAETFEHNNIILQALGTADTVQVDLTYCELQAGDVLMLCSDGLSGMVRFDEIREVMRTTPEPIDTCKVLIDRANQAGGHDNVTVIVAMFDGEGLAHARPDAPPFKYCKYVLPEEPSDTEPNRRMVPEVGISRPPSSYGGTALPQGLGATALFSSQPPSGSAALAAPSTRIRSSRPPGGYEEERIEIPGTHVPPWVVVIIVVSVVLMLAGFAFLFLR